MDGLLHHRQPSPARRAQEWGEASRRGRVEAAPRAAPLAAGVHGLDIFYSNVVLDGEMTGFWTKLPLLRALMVAHPEVELLWWVESDAVFTDMLFEPPWGKYARHNLLLHGWDDEMDGARNWLGANTGSFVLQNCRWSLDLLDALAL